MHKEKLLAEIRTAKYLDKKTKRDLLARTKNLSEKEAAKRLAVFPKLAKVAQKLEQEKDELIAKVLHVFRGMNNYSKRRVRKEALEKSEQLTDRDDLATESTILSQIENA